MESFSRRILALETSGRVGSVAVGTEAGVAASRLLAGELAHKSALVPTIDELLREQGWPANTISDVFVSIGPGSFTGLRIGVTIARTLAWSIGARIVAVETLDGLACNAQSLAEPPVHVAGILYAQRSKAIVAA